MTAWVSRHSLLLPLSLVVIAVVLNCLGAEEGALREGQVLEDVHKVECQYPAKDLIQLQLQELGNTTRTVVASALRKSCDGNVTLYKCFINETFVEVTAIITDLHEEELRTFTCLVLLEKSTGAETKVLGNVNVIKTGPTTDRKSASKESASVHLGEVNNSQTNQEHKQCPGDPTAALTVVITLFVISGVVTLVLFLAYCRARNKITSATDRIEVYGVKVQKVKSASEYQSSCLPPPLDVPGRGHVTPNYMTSVGALVQTTDGDGQSQGLLQYQEPWGQLDDDISNRLAALRPNPRMCLVPGFQRPADVTEKYHDDKEDDE